MRILRTASSGLAAITLAKNHGCHVAATSRSEKARDLILSAGADTFILDDGNISAPLSESPLDRYDKVLELIGVTTLIDSLQCCKRASRYGEPLGVVCVTGASAGKWEMDGFSPFLHVPKGTSLTSYGGGGEEMKMTPFMEIIELVEKGKVKISVGRAWRLEQVVEAHRVMEEGGAGGKMVILM